MHIDWLTEINGAEYGDATQEGVESGTLVVRDEAGDTLLPPYAGRFTVLEEAASRDEAIEAARAWEAQRGAAADA